MEWQLTEKNGGGLGKSPHGVFPMGPEDYPMEKQEAIKKEVGEVAKENPH